MKDAECRKCNKKGHYAQCAEQRLVRYLDDEDDNLLGTVTEEPMVCGAVNWHADLQVTTTTHSRFMKFRIDTGADVPVVPDRFFNKNSPLRQTLSSVQSLTAFPQVMPSWKRYNRSNALTNSAARS